MVLSNEWSASVPTLMVDGVAGQPPVVEGRRVRRRLRGLGARRAGCAACRCSPISAPAPSCGSPSGSLRCGRTTALFRSCNRAFHQDPARRLDHWCGTCDKCCFIDLILARRSWTAPSWVRSSTATEPLENPANDERFRTLLGLGRRRPAFRVRRRRRRVPGCRAAGGRSGPTGPAAAAPAAGAPRSRATTAQRVPEAATLFAPRGPHHIPERYAPADLLVRAR